MVKKTKLIPIYNTRGEVGALLGYPYLFNLRGEWIGWVKPDRRIFSVHGHYAGYLTDEPRILRKQSDGYAFDREQPPPKPPRIIPPATMPLAPLMAELRYGILDVLLDAPELLPCVDFGDLRDDMD